MSPATNWVVVTGASSGIGRACALHLARRGYQVLAGFRKPADEAPLRMDGIHPLRLDVTDPDGIAELSERARMLAGARLCGLVNNAGIGVSGPVEYISLDDWRKQFEVNLFGQMAVTSTLLPLLRLHVASQGPGSAKIIMISSIAGRVAQPILGPYCASKFALEAASDALRLELFRQGIAVVLVEPGAIQSEIWRKGRESADAIADEHPARRQYDQEIEAVVRVAEKAARDALPAEAVARVVADALGRRRPAARYVVGRGAMMAAILKRVLPDRAWDWIILRAFGIRASGK